MKNGTVIGFIFILMLICAILFFGGNDLEALKKQVKDTTTKFENYEMIRQRMRNLGFDGTLEIYDSPVPCATGLNEKYNGCCNLTTNTIFINSNSTNLKLTIYHEWCHWAMKSIDETKVKKCAADWLEKNN